MDRDHDYATAVIGGVAATTVAGMGLSAIPIAATSHIWLALTMLVAANRYEQWEY